MRLTRTPPRALAGLAAVAVLASASGCGDDAKPKAVKTQTTSSAERATAASVTTAEQAVQASPNDPVALEGLIVAHIRLAYLRGNPTGNTIGDAGAAELRKAAVVWERYLALDPAKPNLQVATLMARAFGQAGLNEPPKVVPALELAVKHTRPASANLYSQLAIALYRVKLYRRADRASQRAVRLSPPNQRGDLRTTLRQIRSQAKTQGP